MKELRNFVKSLYQGVGNECDQNLDKIIDFIDKLEPIPPPVGRDKALEIMLETDKLWEYKEEHEYTLKKYLLSMYDALLSKGIIGNREVNKEKE